MSYLQTHYGQLVYTIEGDGFPLILIPDRSGAITDWSQQIPLLAELCRVIAYEHQQPCSENAGSDLNDAFTNCLVSVLDILAVERAYLAGWAGGGHTALNFAQHHPSRSEGLLLIGIDGDLTAVPLPEIAVPTCVFVGAEAPSHMAHATQLASRLPRCAKIVIPDAGTSPHREQPLPLGHAMMGFLIQCERQRNLVRGASFLL